VHCGAWQHHEYRGSIGFAAEYASPVEDLVSAFPSSFVLTTLLGMHPLLWFLWVAYRLQQTYEAHSGWVSHSAWLLWLLSLLMSQLMVVLLALVSQWPLLWLLSQLLVLVKSCVTSRKG
jgi:hypothetical protein